MSESQELNSDLMVGVKIIADFLGVPDRRVFYWAETKKLPLFKIGSLWAGKKSTLRRHFAELEASQIERPAEDSDLEAGETA